LEELSTNGSIALDVEGEKIELDREDLQVRLQAKEGWAAAEGSKCVVVLSTELTDSLIREGLIRDLVRAIQDRRKELGCEFTDRIDVGIVTDSEILHAALEEHRDYLTEETLSHKLVLDSLAGDNGISVTLGEHQLHLFVEVVKL